MNIVYVTGLFAQNQFSEVLGGMPKAVYNHARAMKERGNNVRILSAGACNKKWYYKGIEIWTVYADNDFSVDTGHLFFNILYRELRIKNAIKKMHSEQHIDIIQYTGWFGVGLLHNRRIPAIMRISSYTKGQLAGNYFPRKVRLLSILEVLAARRMEYVFAPSNIMANAMKKDLKKDVQVIETPYFRENVIEKDDIYCKYCQEKKYFLFFGRMSKDKGIYVIRDIIYELLDKYKEYYFVFAGSYDKSSGSNIKIDITDAAAEFSNRIIFIGNIKHELLFPVIRRASAVIMPSIKDNLPNGCAESMSLKTIVIGTYDSSIEQFITDGVSGLLSKPDSSRDLLSTIDRFMNMDEIQKQNMKNEAIKKLDSLNSDDYFDKLEIVYHHLVNCKALKNHLGKI